jgi:serine phosphatase RsbU (regulator of sigma subunit)
MVQSTRSAPEAGQEPATSVPKEQIALRAYGKWSARSRSCEHALQDWLEAEADLGALRGLIRRLAKARERIAHLVVRRGRAARRLVAEHAVSSILAVSESLIAAAPKLIRAICESLGWDVGAVWLVDSTARVLRCVEVWHATGVEMPTFERLTRQMTFALGDGLPGRVWATGSLLWVPDVAVEPLCPRGPVAAEAGLHGAIGFPIRSGAEVFGALEFFSREVRRPDERLTGMMTSIGSQISQFVECRAAEGRLLARAHDRRIGREIQQGLLPGAPPHFPGFEIAGRALAANDVGGDCFDFIHLTAAGPERLCVAVADASGHGIGAALLTGQTRAYLRALSLAYADIGLLLTLTNQRLTADAASDHFVTAILVSLDSSTRSLAYASAGHVPGYVLDARGQTKAVLPSTDLPLGIDLATVFSASPAIPLEPGDLVVLLTDGIVEAASPSGARFGLERAVGLVRQHRQEAPGEMLTALFDAVCGFCDNRLQDDLTAVIIKCEGAA